MKKDDVECLHYSAKETKESYDLHLEFLESIKQFYNKQPDYKQFHKIILALTYLLNTLMASFEIASREAFLNELTGLTNELYAQNILAGQSKIYEENLH